MVNKKESIGDVKIIEVFVAISKKLVNALDISIEPIPLFNRYITNVFLKMNIIKNIKSPKCAKPPNSNTFRYAL